MGAIKILLLLLLLPFIDPPCLRLCNAVQLQLLWWLVSRNGVPGKTSSHNAAHRTGNNADAETALYRDGGHEKSIRDNKYAASNSSTMPSWHSHNTACKSFTTCSQNIDCLVMDLSVCPVLYSNPAEITVICNRPSAGARSFQWSVKGKVMYNFIIHRVP